MYFAFYDRINAAKHEETDEWWNGLNRIYNSLVYDYLYEDPAHVMAFIDNHDTDRFLGNGKDSTALRQALALLLTINRIPQLYYGKESIGVRASRLAPWASRLSLYLTMVST